MRLEKDQFRPFSLVDHALLKAGANPREPFAPVSSPLGAWRGAPPAPPVAAGYGKRQPIRPRT